MSDIHLRDFRHNYIVNNTQLNYPVLCGNAVAFDGMTYFGALEDGLVLTEDLCDACVLVMFAAKAEGTWCFHTNRRTL